MRQLVLGVIVLLIGIVLGYRAGHTSGERYASAAEAQVVPAGGPSFENAGKAEPGGGSSLEPLVMPLQKAAGVERIPGAASSM